MKYTLKNTDRLVSVFNKNTGKTSVFKKSELNRLSSSFKLDSYKKFKKYPCYIQDHFFKKMAENL